MIDEEAGASGYNRKGSEELAEREDSTLGSEQVVDFMGDRIYPADIWALADFSLVSLENKDLSTVLQKPTPNRHQAGKDARAPACALWMRALVPRSAWTARRALSGSADSVVRASNATNAPISGPVAETPLSRFLGLRLTAEPIRDLTIAAPLKRRVVRRVGLEPHDRVDSP